MRLPSASKFSSEELARIEKAVADAEARTSGEIVPVILEASDDYSWLRSSVGMKAAVLSFALIELVGLFHWPVPWRDTLMIALSITALAIVLSMIPSIARLLVGDERMRTSVGRTARALFVNEGVSETRDRSGVLILVSMFERRIEIIADRGIHEKLGPDYWARLCHEYGSHVKNEGQVKALCSVVTRVGDELARYFPRRADDRNELSDSLRVASPDRDGGPK